MVKITFELPADDMDRAARFYNDAFGWTALMTPVGSAVIDADGNDVDPQNSSGVFTPRNEFVQAPVLIIPVDSVDDAVRRVVRAGGTMLTEKEAVGTYGHSAYGKDTEGTVFCLWQAAA